MATLQELLGGGLPAGLLSPEQEAAAERRAQNAALLNFAGQAAPSLGQIVGQAGPVGMQAYQQSFDQTLANLLRGVQVSQLGSQIQRQRALQEAKSLPTTEEQIKALQRLGAYDEIANIGKATQELRRAGLMRPAGAEEMPSPFAPYLQAQSPNVRQLAQTYDSGFRSGRIDEDTADKRIADLARMEESFVSRVESATDRRVAREEARQERQLTREQAAKPTEGEKKTATLAGRLEQSLTDLQKIEQEKPGALRPEVVPSLLQSGVLSYLPGAEMIAGKISSSDRLRAEAAQLDALDAALTLGTGAAYTREQLRGYARAYFPQIGDTPEVIAEKNTRFANIVRLARSQAGSAYVPPSQEAAPNISNVRGRYNLEGRR